MKRFLALLVGLLVCGAAHAQVLTAMVVASCGTPPQTYNSGLTYPITMDVTGNLCNGASVFGAVTTNLTQLAGATLGAPSNYGTSPGAVNVQGVNAFVTNLPTTPAAIYSGQQLSTLAAAALPARALVNGIVITAQLANTGTSYIGPAGVTASNGYPLVAGQSISYAVTNLNAVYVIGTNTTDVIAFTGN